MDQFVGSMVSLHCGEVLGSYQGIVIAVNASAQTITLGKPYCNGVQGKVPTITISAKDIHDLKILKTSEEAQTLTQVNHVHKPVRSHEVTPTLQPLPEPLPKQPTLQEPEPEVRSSRSGSRGRGWSSPRRMDNSTKQGGGRNQECFSTPVESFLNDEFDFEKNLAMFDKQAVFAEIEYENGSCSRPSRTPVKEQKYKCDENVLPSKPTVYRQILTGSSEKNKSSSRTHAGPHVEYVTDEGLVVPSVSYELRCRLLAGAVRCGLGSVRQVEAVGRSAAEMVLQLLGGSIRLAPQNSHQRPRVVVLCGSHMQGAQAANCARHLAMHKVNVTVFQPPIQTTPAAGDLQSETKLLAMTDAVLVNNSADLPSTPVDIIVCGLDGHEKSGSSLLQAWYRPLVGWVGQKRAPILAIDPPDEETGITAKWGLSVALPLHGAHRTCTQMYLCDLSIPAKVYSQANVTYTSPFGHKFVIPLHNKS